MNLMYEAMEPCVKMEQAPIEDAGGGYSSVGWRDVLSFDGFVRKETAPEINVAEQEVVKETFTLVVKIGTDLKYHDVFRRVRDGAIFRMISNTDDGQTLSQSSVPIAAAGCERWVLT